MSGINEALARTAKLHLVQEIVQFKNLPVTQIKYELFGQIEILQLLGLLKSEDAKHFRNEINKIKPMER